MREHLARLWIERCRRLWEVVAFIKEARLRLSIFGAQWGPVAVALFASRAAAPDAGKVPHLVVRSIVQNLRPIVEQPSDSVTRAGIRPATCSRGFGKKRKPVFGEGNIGRDAGGWCRRKKSS